MPAFGAEGLDVRAGRLGHPQPVQCEQGDQGVLGRRGTGFRSLHEALDTTTPGGRLVFHVFAALAEFERDIIRERTRAGLDAARARGKRGGRPRKLDAKKKTQARTL